MAHTESPQPVLLCQQRFHLSGLRRVRSYVLCRLCTQSRHACAHAMHNNQIHRETTSLGALDGLSAVFMAQTSQVVMNVSSFLQG